MGYFKFWFLSLICILGFVEFGCKPEVDNSTQIASNFVKNVLIDPTGKKWFATDKGISVFDHKRDKFLQIKQAGK